MIMYAQNWTLIGPHVFLLQPQVFACLRLAYGRPYDRQPMPWAQAARNSGMRAAQFLQVCTRTTGYNASGFLEAVCQPRGRR